MNSLDLHIAYLLFRHDCVIVPGLGAFIAMRRPARFDASAGLLAPPSRELSFNGAMADDNDGLLVRSVARRSGVTYTRASDMVADEVDSLRRQLDAFGEVTIARVGVLKQGSDGATPGFEAVPDCIVASAFEPLGAMRRPEAPQTNVPAAPRPYGRRRQTVAAAIVRAAAVVALCVAVAAALLTGFSRQGEPRADYASMAPSLGVSPSQRAVADVASGSAGLFIACPSDPDAMQRVEAPENITVPQQNAAAPVYCIVVASLPSRAAALRFIAGEGDPSLQILESGNRRFRVYAAAAGSQAAAMAARETVAARYPDAWICEPSNI